MATAPAAAEPAAGGPAPLAFRLPAAGGIAAFALCAALLPRAPGVGDAAEMTLALAQNGLPHPTGYPLYVLFGSPFTRALHALGVDWVRAAALWSAAGGAVMAAALLALGARLAPASRAALVPAALVVFHPVTLQAATEAEVHTWWYAWFAAFALATRVALEAVAAGRVTRAGALGWGALAGAGLAHHAAGVLVLVPLGAALGRALLRARALRPALVLAALAGALVPLASYGFVAWRAFHPVAVQWPAEPSATGVWAHVRGAAYAFYLGGWAPGPSERALLGGAVFPLLVPGLAGLAWLAWRDRAARPWWTALLAGALLLMGFAFRYGVPDPARYFMPALMAGALAAAPAFAAVERRLSRGLAVLLLAAIVVSAAAWSLRLTLDENRRRERAEARIRAAWLGIPFERAIVMWQDDHVHRLKLYQTLAGERPGLYVENPNRLTWTAPRAAFERRFGFDPLAGITLRSRDDVARITARLRDRAPVPVVDFRETLEAGARR